MNPTLKSPKKGQSLNRLFQLCRLFFSSCITNTLRISHNSVASACEKASCWQLALSIPTALGSHSDLITFSAAISACENAQKWQQAIALLKELQIQRLEANLIVYNAVLSACERSKHWQHALDFFHHMKVKTVKPNAITCASTLDAIAQSFHGEPITPNLLRELSSILESLLKQRLKRGGFNFHFFPCEENRGKNESSAIEHGNCDPQKRNTSFFPLKNRSTNSHDRSFSLPRPVCRIFIWGCLTGCGRFLVVINWFVEVHWIKSSQCVASISWNLVMMSYYWWLDVSQASLFGCSSEGFPTSWDDAIAGSAFQLPWLVISSEWMQQDVYGSNVLRSCNQAINACRRNEERSVFFFFVFFSVF